MEKELTRKKIFLGGTCNGSIWRDELIPYLRKNRFDYYNPVVSDWGPEHVQIEDREKKNSDILLYLITPESDNLYTIAEVVDDVNNRPEKTIFCIVNNYKDKFFNNRQIKSLKGIIDIVQGYGAGYLYVENMDSWPEKVLYIIKKCLKNIENPWWRQ